MKRRTTAKFGLAAIAVAAFGLVAECHGAAASSTPSAVWVKPEESLQWKTVMSAGKPIALDWPKGAASAQLTIAVDGAVVAQTNITDTAAREVMVIPPTLPAEYAAERVLVVSVEYWDSGSTTLDTASVRLGWVTGVAGNGTRVIPAASGKEWREVNKYAVLPIPEGTTALSVDSAGQTFDAPGWWEWSHVRAGEHELVLTAGGDDFAATLRGLGAGFSFIVY